MDRDSIFRYNWYSKLVPYLDPDFGQQLTSQVILYLQQYSVDMTNYSAVELESLSWLYAYTRNKKELEPWIAHELIQLSYQRTRNGLYLLDDQIVRFDIVGHIINGICQLV